MAINPNIDGSTVDPKWIDGGPGNMDPTFNVDDPTMWSPMTVISGLASGLCERAAYIKNTASGFPAGLTWVNEQASGHAGNATQVEKTANNIAIPGGVNSLFTNTSSAFFMPPGTAAGSNYMQAFDSAMMCLITSGGYVTKDGATFSFSTLANAASARAGSNSSAMQSAPEQYGADFAQQMYIAYPKEWATERKWMLDELKYTMGDTGDINDIEFKYLPAGGSSVTNAGGTITYSSAFNAIKSGLEWDSDSNLTTSSGYLVQYRYSSSIMSEIRTPESAYMPYAAVIGLPSNTTPIPSIKLYLDAPQSFMDAYSESVDYVDIKDSVRQDLAKKVPEGPSTQYLLFGDSSSYIINSGATTTFLVASNMANLNSAYIESCVLLGSPTIVEESGYSTSSSVIYNAEIAGGTVTSAACGNQYFYIDAAEGAVAVLPSADLIGGQLVSGRVLEVIQEPTESTNGIYKLDYCSVTGATVTQDFTSYVHYGSASGAHTVKFPYYIGALTISNGGVAKVDAAHIRGGNLNLCKGGEFVPVNSAGAASGVSIIGGGTYTIPSGINAMPTLFPQYLSDNKPVFKISDSSTFYKEPTLLIGSGPAAGQHVTSMMFTTDTYLGNNFDHRAAMAIVKNGLSTCTDAQIDSINASSFSDNAHGAIICVGKNTKLTIVGPSHTYDAGKYIAIGGGTISLISSGLMNNTNIHVTIMNGAELSIPMRLDGYGYGTQEIGSWTCLLPGGTVSISSCAYIPSLLYYNGNTYSRAASFDSAHRAAWSSGTAKIWTDAYAPSQHEPVYTAATVTTSAGTATDNHNNGINVNQIFGMGLHRGRLTLYDGASVKTTLTNMSITSGGLTTSNYSLITDIVSDCHISGGASSCDSYTSDGYTIYEWTLTNCALIYYEPYSDSWTSVGKIVSGIISSAGSPFTYDPTYHTFNVARASVTFNAPVPIFPDGAYVSFNPMAVTGVSRGWDVKSVLESSAYWGGSKFYVYAGSLDSSAAMAAISASTIGLGGVSVQIGSASNTLAMDAISRTSVGFSCYGIDQAIIDNHYSSFRCRQFYKDPDEQTQTPTT